MPRVDSDEALMLAYAAGDGQAFDELYGRHKSGLYRFILRGAHSHAQAEELFQDVWMRLIHARGRYEPSAKFRTFLYSIAHNRLIDHYRAADPNVVSLFGDDDDPIVDPPAPRTWQPDVQSQSRRQGSAILAALAELPAPQREAFLMHEEGGLSVEEIATAAGITFEAAKSRLRYAIGKLRAVLGEVA